MVAKTRMKPDASRHSPNVISTLDLLTCSRKFPISNNPRRKERTTQEVFH
jgi:hypothetical protein